MKPLRRFSAKLACRKVEKEIEKTLAPQSRAFRAALGNFASEQESKDFADKLDDFILKVTSKVIYHLTEGRIESAELDGLQKPSQALIEEFAKPGDKWDQAVIKQHWDHIHSVLQGHLQRLITGHTLERLQFIREFVTSSKILSAVAKPTSATAEEFRKLLVQACEDTEVPHDFVTLYVAARNERTESERISDQLERDHHINSLKFKVLLLGAGESGKSTIMSQLQSIYHAQSPHEVQPPNDNPKFYRTVLHENVLESLTLLLNAYAEEYGAFPENCAEDCEWARHLPPQMAITPDTAKRIQNCWQHSSIRKSVGRLSHTHYIPDSAKYYMTNVRRFAAETFVPNETDKLMARIRTTGVMTKQFPHPPVSFQFVDVGGQRNERRKWLHCFSDVKAIFFVVNLAGFSKITFEEKNRNRMREALDLFKETSHRKEFSDTPIFLFLNKQDLFDEEVQFLENGDCGIRRCFPEYAGDIQSAESCSKFITEQFDMRLPNGKGFSGVYILSAHVRKQVKDHFDEVMTDLVARSKKEIDSHLHGQNKALGSLSRKSNPLRSF